MKKNLNWHTAGVIAAVLATARLASAETDAQLLKEAKVQRAQAEKTALAKVSNGKITSGEIERENGKLIWSFDIAKSGAKNITEVQVDAMTGAIASMKVETPKDQATEAAADRAGRK